MEGEIKNGFLVRGSAGILVSVVIGVYAGFTVAQEKAPAVRPEGAEITLRKSIKTRPYQGQEVEGEDRQIRPGDSLWRILVEEKGVSGKQFRSYLVIIRGLNPKVKNLDLLRIGDRVFIPLRPSELLEGQATIDEAAKQIPPGSGSTIDYRVKAGEHLYQILREQLKLTEDREVAQYYALVQDLNPGRKNWDELIEGEVIRLPLEGPLLTRPVRRAGSTASPPGRDAATTRAEAAAAGVSLSEAEEQTGSTLESVPAVETQVPASPDRHVILASQAKENLALLAKVAESMGNEVDQSGEEVIKIKNGAVRFDKRNYPVIYSPLHNLKVVLDPEDNIPQSLRAKLADSSIGVPIVPMANGVSLQEAVISLLVGLGYQALPPDRPVVIQEEGVAYEARGDWMALSPEESNKRQEIYVINLNDDGAAIPGYLRDQLAKKGLHLKDVWLSSPVTEAREKENKRATKDIAWPVKHWPRDKRDIIDNLLFTFGIPFGVAETLSVELQNGIRVDAQSDRVFELSGQRVALFFQKPDADFQQALQEKDGARAVAIEIASLTSRDVIARLLSLIDEPLAYREHRFPAAAGSTLGGLTITAWGFHVPKRSLFLTDRKIPTALNRFFSEQGLEIVYFQ